ncbi:MAG: type II toxin-antitoxin system PemK/MazF family toxin [Deltaproteobacteria bacterium]|nr:type II toxin-antitoxin system PemK/MazF family toxin [Deltaproteobacteria bacterium]
MNPGDVCLVPFPNVEATTGKLRPVLVVASCPGTYNDVIVRMIPSRTHQAVQGVDEIIDPRHKDLRKSGLKVRSAVRIARLATVDPAIFVGRLGGISQDRLSRIRKRLCTIFSPSAS